MVKPAIVTIGYNRLDSLIRLWKSIQNASYDYNDITLVASIDESDQSDKIEAAFNEIEWIHGNKTIIRYPIRQGLRQHILQCGDLSAQYGAVIMLEDDLVVSPEFYNFTVNALNRYSEIDCICGISLYSHSWNGYANCEFCPVWNGYDVYLGQFSITWGQCWTDSNWRKFRDWLVYNETKFDYTPDLPTQVFAWGEKSWGRYFFKYITERNLFYVIPYKAMSTNFSDVGEHNNAASTAYQVPMSPIMVRTYCFAEIEDIIKYDAFFERIMTEGDRICGIQGDLICVDLNCSKRQTGNKKYLLTTRKLNYEVVKTFGMSLRPIELNVFLNVSGNRIVLYKLPYLNIELPSRKMGMERMAYEVYGLRYESMFMFSVHAFIEKVRIRIMRILGR